MQRHPSYVNEMLFRGGWKITAKVQTTFLTRAIAMFFCLFNRIHRLVGAQFSREMCKLKIKLFSPLLHLLLFSFPFNWINKLCAIRHIAWARRRKKSYHRVFDMAMLMQFADCLTRLQTRFCIHFNSLASERGKIAYSISLDFSQCLFLLCSKQKHKTHLAMVHQSQALWK